MTPYSEARRTLRNNVVQLLVTLTFGTLLLWSLLPSYYAAGRKVDRLIEKAETYTTLLCANPTARAKLENHNECEYNEDLLEARRADLQWQFFIEHLLSCSSPMCRSMSTKLTGSIDQILTIVIWGSSILIAFLIYKLIMSTLRMMIMGTDLPFSNPKPIQYHR